MKSKPIAVGECPQYANIGKQNKLHALVKEYRKTAGQIAKAQWNIFFSKGKFDRYVSLKHIQSKLSERYKQTCLWQVVSVLESWTSNLANYFRQIVINSNLPQERKKALLYINSFKGWFLKTPPREWINQEDIKLARKIFKHIFHRWRKPSFKHIAMHLDQKVAVLEKNTHSKSFDYWLKVSTLDKRKPVYVPLKANRYLEGLEGEYLNFYQIIEEDGKLKVKLVKEIKDKKDKYIPATGSIGIDIGLNPLVATSKGDLIGRKFFEFLKSYDQKISKRMAELQRKGLKPSKDKKYKELVRRFREFLKNEINRHINRLIETERPKRIVVEKLNFRSPELSKRLNRLIQNFGKRYIKEKLKRLEEIYGIEVIEINPAYTSQECSSCGYIDKSNRKSTEKFECRLCGKKANAQVNSAKNILKRASLLGLRPTTAKKKVLEVLIKRHLERLKGCNSAALEVLKANLYYRDFLNPCSGRNKFL
ncbi:MAG: transposase [Candidatus Aenigmatarchaeota archaeon]